MHLFARTSALARAEERLFASGLVWWRKWTKDSAVPTITHANMAGVHYVTGIAATADEAAVPLVCLHGYASGTGIFYSALAPLAERWATGPVHILDSPGCGLSDRPKWTLPQGNDCPLDQAEGFAIGRIETWRQSMGIHKMVLCGHSIGGYLATAYTERYPQHVERLILVSPVGIPRPPLSAVRGTPEHEKRMEDTPLRVKLILGAWERGWGPFPIIKWGPGRWLMQGFVKRRFRDASWQDKEALADYFCCNLSHGEPSWGGVAHALLLMPMAYARSPLCDRIPKLRFCSTGAKGPRAVSFIYGGDGDWMSKSHASALQGPRPDGIAPLPIEVASIAYAGHNIMADNPVGMADAVAASGRSRGFDGVLFGEDAWRQDVTARQAERQGASIAGSFGAE